MWNRIKNLFNLTASTYEVRLNPSKKSILVIDDDLPQYDKSSGSKRLMELIRLFIHLDLNVVFMPDDGLQTAPYYNELKTLGVQVLHHDPDRKSMLRMLKKILPDIDFAWVSRPMLNLRFQKVLKKNKKIKLIFDTVDLHYVRMLRQAENEHNGKLMKKALKVKKLEINLAKAANATLTVTGTEKKLLEAEGVENVYIIPNVHEAVPQKTTIPFGERAGIVFIGGYRHEPNTDAVKWLVHAIMPRVWEKLGNIPLYLLGSYPGNEVLELGNEHVHVPGYLREVDHFFTTARLFVAPLRYGAGMKGKIGQSLEFGLPVVSTGIGAEGMHLMHRENILIADTAEDFAENIIALYQDEALWNKIRGNAHFAISEYSAENVTKQLKALFNHLEQDMAI